jgi:hypothetical protein
MSPEQFDRLCWGLHTLNNLRRVTKRQAVFRALKP